MDLLREALEWNIEYGSNLLRKLLAWDERKIDLWARSLREEPDSVLPVLLNKSHEEHISHFFIPSRLAQSLKGRALFELQCKLEKAITGEDDPDYADGADVPGAAHRIDLLLREYGESLESLRSQT